MKIRKYMKIHIFQTSEDIIAQSNLNCIVSPGGWVYIDILKGIPDLKQAGRIAQMTD